MGIKVRATQPGYYDDIIRKPGKHEYFEVQSADELSENWMAPANAEAAAAFDKKFENYEDPRKAITDPEGDAEPKEPKEAKEPDLKLENAIRALDPNNDEHWTSKGLPAMAPIEEAMGDAEISRKDVEAAVPAYTRDIAHARFASNPATN